MRYMKKYAKSPFAATKNVPLRTHRKSFGLRHGKHASEKRFLRTSPLIFPPFFVLKRTNTRQNAVLQKIFLKSQKFQGKCSKKIDTEKIKTRYLCIRIREEKSIL